MSGPPPGGDFFDTVYTLVSVILNQSFLWHELVKGHYTDRLNHETTQSV